MAESAIPESEGEGSRLAMAGNGRQHSGLCCYI